MLMTDTKSVHLRHKGMDTKKNVIIKIKPTAVEMEYGQTKFFLPIDPDANVVVIDNKERTVKVCPLCNKKYVGVPGISRRDNKTPICSECAQREAIDIYMACVEEEKRRATEKA